MLTAVPLLPLWLDNPSPPPLEPTRLLRVFSSSSLHLLSILPSSILSAFFSLYSILFRLVLLFSILLCFFISSCISPSRFSFLSPSFPSLFPSRVLDSAKPFQPPITPSPSLSLSLSPLPASLLFFSLTVRAVSCLRCIFDRRHNQSAIHTPLLIATLAEVFPTGFLENIPHSSLLSPRFVSIFAISLSTATVVVSTPSSTSPPTVSLRLRAPIRLPSR